MEFGHPEQIRAVEAFLPKLRSDGEANVAAGQGERRAVQLRVDGQDSRPGPVVRKGSDFACGKSPMTRVARRVRGAQFQLRSAGEIPSSSDAAAVGIDLGERPLSKANRPGVVVG